MVVDGCDDGSIELVEELRRDDERLVARCENGGASAARQAGVEAASGEVVVLLDDDVVAEPGLVTGHARAHADRDGVVVVGYAPVAAPGGQHARHGRRRPLRRLVRGVRRRIRGAAREPARELLGGQRLAAPHRCAARRPALARDGADVQRGPRLRPALPRGGPAGDVRSPPARAPLLPALLRRPAPRRAHVGCRALAHPRRARRRRRIVPVGRVRGRAPARARGARRAVPAAGAAAPAPNRAGRRGPRHDAARARGPSAGGRAPRRAHRPAGGGDRASREVRDPLPVTVVIPAYNRPAMVRRALESVRRQTRDPPR